MDVLSYMRSRLRHLIVDAGSGQGLVEYALILALIALVAIVGVTFLGQALGIQFGIISDAVEAAGP